ncbi:MAG: Crp/Fnr family transcriptional regulator [Syntrophobacteraceae bacterium]
MTQGRTKFWYLKNIDMLRRLNDEQFQMVHDLSTMRKIKKGETLYLEGSSDKNIYILKEGVVKITRVTSGGREVTLELFKQGSIFGEMAIIDPQERTESAEVVEDGLICKMAKRDFDRLIEQAPSLSTQITKMIGFRRCSVENKLIDMLFNTVEQRLAKVLLNLLDDFGMDTGDGRLIDLRLTHRDLAALTASTRETMTATMNKFKNEGIIRYQGKHIVVQSTQGLRCLAE